jgi:outer membrane biosynthesis protein TonB
MLAPRLLRDAAVGLLDSRRRRLIAFAVFRICTASPALAGQLATRSPQGGEVVSIGAYIRAHLTGIDECYGQRLNSNPLLRGRLMLRFDIGPQGEVANASADGLSDRKLIDCVLAQARTWRFEWPPAGTRLRVAYPVSFQPG